MKCTCYQSTLAGDGRTDCHKEGCAAIHNIQFAKADKCNESAWTEIFGADELPEGVWLVEIQEERVGTVYHVATKIGLSVAIVGSCFHFDMPPIIAYAPIPER